MRRRSPATRATLPVLLAAAALSGAAGAPGAEPATAEGVRIEGAAEALPQLNDAATIEDYLTYAALANPGLRETFERWKAAQEEVPQVTSLPDPLLTYGYSAREERHRIGVMQMSPWFGTLALRGEVATEAARAAHARHEEARWDLFDEVRQAYYEHYYLGRAIAVVRENIELLRYLEELVRSAYRVDLARQTDVIRTQVELGKLEDLLRSQEDLRGPVVARLNAALNRKSDEALPWPRTPALVRLLATEQEVLARVAESSPRLAMLDHEIAEAERAEALARREKYPDISFGVEYLTPEDTGFRSLEGDGNEDVMATIGIGLPVYRNRYRAAERAAEARRLAAQARRSEAENRLVAETQLALYRYRDALRKIDLYLNALIPKAEQSLQVVQLEYQTGIGTITDVIDAERILLEFQLAYERAVADHAQSLSALERLAGAPLPTEAVVPETSTD